MVPGLEVKPPAQGHRWDVVVVGAGPAGSLAALLLARQGVRVLLVERRQFPRWKVCGACLSPQAQAALAAVGLEPLLAEGQPLEQLQLGVAGRVVPLALGRGLALSRGRLDQGLLEAAGAAGATVRLGTRAELAPAGRDCRGVVLHHGGSQDPVAAAVVLVAAGLQPRCLEREPGLQSRVAATSRVGAGCVISGGAGSYPAGMIHMAVGQGGYVGLVRVEDGALNLACALDPLLLRRSGGPAAASAAILAEAGMPPLTGLGDQAWQLTPALTQRTSPVASHRLLLLGDAAGYVEPFTGEGMGWALTSALAAVPLVLRALDGWEAAIGSEWERRHRRWVRRRQGFCHGVAGLVRHPPATALLQQAAARLPRLTGYLINVLQRPCLPPLAAPEGCRWP